MLRASRATSWPLALLASRLCLVVGGGRCEWITALPLPKTDPNYRHLCISAKCGGEERCHGIPFCPSLNIASAPATSRAAGRSLPLPRGQKPIFATESFPQPNLPVLGQTYLFAKNIEIPANDRYGRCAAAAMPVAQATAIRLRADRAGSDTLSLGTGAWAVKFQSTLPRGERRVTALEREVERLFQSTLPRGERARKSCVRCARRGRLTLAALCLG